jgi:hypothetical protein
MQQLPRLVVKKEASDSKESVDGKSSDHELKIAWQYRRSGPHATGYRTTTNVSYTVNIQTPLFQRDFGTIYMK